MALDRDEMRQTIEMLAANNNMVDILEALAWYVDLQAAGIEDDQERQPYVIASEALYTQKRHPKTLTPRKSALKGQYGTIGGLEWLTDRSPDNHCERLYGS